MGNFDPDSPVFVLCVALFRIDDYLSTDLRLLSEVKFRHWWHDAVVFHGYKIRRKVPPFQALADKNNLQAFLGSINGYFEHSTATIIAAAINKPAHLRQYRYPVDPYDLALGFCLERCYGELLSRRAVNAETMFVFERRGKKEDRTITTTFAKVVDGANQWHTKLPFRISFASKEENITGLQIADLAAYPIARFVAKNHASRRDWQAVLPRIRRGPKGNIEGWGLKVFP